MPMLAQVVSTAARPSEQIWPARAGDVSCCLHEAAALITTTPELGCALRHPQGDIQGPRCCTRACPKTG
ncbi:hypothetical protein CP976_02225 [Streptomyces coeruleorubidus]|uniref:Uncharacterized protein n=1 Tax=Streptomyces coeruleorubidus TaxID=116188 RepID=A0A5J6HXE3_STRC4|nr:hypothetical protein CP976_02225 [Streptomyces coeruleorubidus]